MPEEKDLKNWEPTENMGKDVKDTNQLSGWANPQTSAEKSKNSLTQHKVEAPDKKNLGGLNKL